MKKLIISLLSVVILSQSVVGVSANEDFEIPNGSAIFSIEEIESDGKVVYKNSELNYIIEVIKETENGDSKQAESFSLQNSTYTISYNSLTENISYKVVVNNNNFTQVHSGTYSVVGYFVESSSLRLVNSKFTTYSFVNKLVLKQWTSSLDAKINSSNELVVSLIK